MPEVILTPGQLAPPACGYANEQERHEAFTDAIEGAIIGDVQWQSSVEQPDDLTLHWLKLDADGRQVATLKYSEADARFVRWRNLPATDGLVGGTADAITLTFSPAFTAATAYQRGRIYNFLAASDSTVAGVTVDVDGVGAVTVTKYGGTVLVPGDIQAGQMVSLMANGTTFELLNPRDDRPAQFLTYESGLVPIPASGATLPFSHGFLNGAIGIFPHMVRVVLVRTAAGQATFTFDDGSGSATIEEDQEVEVGCFWSGFSGTDNELYTPVFRVKSDDSAVFVTAFYPHGIAYATMGVAANLGSSQPTPTAITPTDYSLKVYATALNPDF